MAAFSGKGGSATVGSIGILEATWKTSDVNEMVDVTPLKGSAGSHYKTFVAGLETWTGEVTGFIDGTTAHAKPTGAVSVTLSDGNNTHAGDAFVTSLDIDVDVSGPAAISIGLQGTGIILT